MTRGEYDSYCCSFLEVYQAAMDLYGLIHARFILSQRGRQEGEKLQVLASWRKNIFSEFLGTAPELCAKDKSCFLLEWAKNSPLLESKYSHLLTQVYCPKCQEVYIPRQKHLDIDGAYFGTSFPHIFLQTFQELVPPQGAGYYVPRIYGFRIYQQKGSKYYRDVAEI